MFFRLGVLNVRRQLTRSMLVILTLAMAAISLTYSLAMQEIPPLRVAPFLSNFTGGQILAIPFCWAGQQTSDMTGQQTFRSANLVPSGASWLEWFFPELYSRGFWVPAASAPREFFTATEVAELAAFAGVDRAVTTPTLPVVVHALGDIGIVDYRLRIAPLANHIMDLTRDRKQVDQFMHQADGIFFNDNASILKNKQRYRQAGHPVELLLPQLDQNGQLDLQQASSIELPFGAYLKVPTRTVTWMDPLNGAVSEVGHFTGDIAWVGQTAWQEIEALVGGGRDLPISNLTLRVADLQDLDTTIAALSEAFPQFTFFNIGSVEDRFFHAGMMEYFRQAPRSVWSQGEAVNLVMPTSFSRVTAGLLILIAAILLGGHMLTGVAARHQEIGTLRALGARRRDILALGFSEAVTLTVIGVTAGFFPLRLLGFIMQLRGGQPFMMALFGLIVEYSQILSIALAASLLFALFPVWRLATVAPMEVLRHE